MQPAEDLLDLLKMLPAMLGAKHVERAARRFVSPEEVVGQRRHLAIGLRWQSRLPVTFLLTLAVAALSYRYLERPFLRLKQRYARVESAPV